MLSPFWLTGGSSPAPKLHVTVVVPRVNVAPDAVLNVGVMAPSTMSAALAEYVTTAPDGPVASAVMLVGSVSAGAVVSTTVTPNEPLDRLSCASWAEQFTV